MGRKQTKEDDIVQCKVCGEHKRRILMGKYPAGNVKKFVDPMGDAWNGRVCPDCHKKEQAKRLKNKRKGESV